MHLHPSFPVDNIFQIMIEPVTVNNMSTTYLLLLLIMLGLLQLILPEIMPPTKHIS